MERKHYFILRSLVTKYGKNEFGWFAMDTSNEVIRTIKNIFKTSILKKIVKGIVTESR